MIPATGKGHFGDNFMSKIVHVNKAFWPDTGGVETVCRQYVEISKSEFDEIVVLTIGPKKGFRVSTEFINQTTVRRCDYQFNVSGHKFSLQLMFMLWRYCLSGAVIHLHEPFPLASLPLMLALRLNLIVTYHSDIVKQKWLRLLINMFRWVALRRADIVTVTSKNLMQNSKCFERSRLAARWWFHFFGQ